jgi:type VI secretion system ImpM family protein
MSTGKFFRALLGGSASGAFEMALSTYGKLPIYKDFLRSNLAGPESVAMKTWLDRGFSRYWEDRDSCRDTTIEPHAFMLLLPETSHTILGYLWGSHDSGGLRRFPFAVFGTLPPVRGAASALSHLMAIAAAARDLRSLQEMIAGLPSVDAFNERARRLGLRIDIPDEDDALQRLRKELSGITEVAFAESLYGAEAATRWPALLNFIARAADLDNSGSLAARFPASDLLPVPCQAALYARLIVRSDGKRRPALGAMMAPGRPGGGVVLLDRFLRADDVLLLNPDLEDFDFVEDLRKGTPKSISTDGPAPADRPLATLLGEA